jgi:hypothetical protein
MGSKEYKIWSLVIYQNISSYNLEFFNILHSVTFNELKKNKIHHSQYNLIKIMKL